MFDLEVKVKVTFKVIMKNTTLNLKLTTEHVLINLGREIYMALRSNSRSRQGQSSKSLILAQNVPRTHGQIFQASTAFDLETKVKVKFLKMCVFRIWILIKTLAGCVMNKLCIFKVTPGQSLFFTFSHLILVVSTYLFRQYSLYE